MHITVIGKYGVVAAVSGMFVGPLPSSGDEGPAYANDDRRLLDRIALQVGAGTSDGDPVILAPHREPTPIRRRQPRKAA